MPRHTETNRERFIAHVQAHQAGLRAFVRALGARPEWVDDLAQEALLRAYREFDRFDEAQDFGRWVRAFARNLVMNERSTTARRHRLLHERIVDVLAARHADAAERHALSAAESEPERLAALRACMAELPDDTRDLVHRRYADGSSASDLARDLGGSADALRQSLLRVRRALRVCIERRLAGGADA